MAEGVDDIEARDYSDLPPAQVVAPAAIGAVAILLIVLGSIAACVIALPLLTAVSDILGILGGALVATTLGGVTPEGYLETTLYYVTLSDVLTGLAKTVFFALIISGTAAYYGFHTEGGTSGVGRSTTATVVVSSLMIFVSDVFMTQLLVTVGY